MVSVSDSDVGGLYSTREVVSISNTHYIAIYEVQGPVVQIINIVS